MNLPESIKMTTAMLMHGYMMKTGACPLPGDIKNMVNAAVQAYREVLSREAEVDAIETAAHEAKDKAREAAREKVRAIVAACVDGNHADRNRVPPRETGVGNHVCHACLQALEKEVRP